MGDPDFVKLGEELYQEWRKTERGISSYYIAEHAFARGKAAGAAEGVIDGLNQARGIVRYHRTAKVNLVPAATAMLDEVDVFLRANVERGGCDGVAEMMDAAPPQESVQPEPTTCEVKMECIECSHVMPLRDLQLLWPKKELKLQVYTDEPDFWCWPCAVELGIEHLPEHDKAAWIAQPQPSPAVVCQRCKGGDEWTCPDCDPEHFAPSYAKPSPAGLSEEQIHDMVVAADEPEMRDIGYARLQDHVRALAAEVRRLRKELAL
jgi:hypothetical protein